MTMKRIRRALWLALAILMALPVIATAEVATEPLEPVAQTQGEIALFDTPVEVEALVTKDTDGGDTVYLLDKKVTYKPAIDDEFYIDLGGYTATKWKSSNTKVATVDSDGFVTCVKKGTANITVTAKKGKKSQTRTLVLKVYDPEEPQKVLIVNDKDTSNDEEHYFAANAKWGVYPGDSGEMNAVVAPDEADQSVTWKSSNNKIFKISSEGTYEAIKPGTVTLSAIANNGKKQTLKVVVHKNKCAFSYTKAEQKKLMEEAIDDGELRLVVKSIEVLSSTKVAAKFVLLNGTDKKVKAIENASISVTADYCSISQSLFEGGASFLDKDIDTLKVACASHGYKAFNVTFTGEDVSDVCWRLSDAKFHACVDFTYDDN